MKLILIYLVVCLAFSLVSSGIVRGNKDATSLSDCAKGRLQFDKNRWYEYDYETVSENAIAGTSKRIPKTRLSAHLSIQYVQDCDFIMQVRSSQLYESFTNETAFVLSSRSDEMSRAMEAFPLLFVLGNGGSITNIKPNKADTNVKVLNMKRGMLSALQLNMEQKHNVTAIELDVSGECEVMYTMKSRNGRSRLRKEKNLASCRHRTAVHSNIEGVAYGKGSALTQSNAGCTYAIHKRGDLRKVHCEEVIFLKPFSSQDEAGAYVRTHQKLSLGKAHTLSSQKIPVYTDFRYESLYFEHDHMDQPSEEQLVTKAKDLLITLADKSYEVTNPMSAVEFSDLVAILRKLSATEIGQLVQEYADCEATMKCQKGRGQSYRSFLFDGLSQCGSTDCVLTLIAFISKGNIPNQQVDHLMAAIAFTQEASSQMLSAILGFHRKTSRPSALLLLGILVHKHCHHWPDNCVFPTPTVGAVDDYLKKLLGTTCSSTTVEQTNQIYYTLKAIGNAGRPEESIPHIVRCAKQAEYVNISIAAIQSMRRMSKYGVPTIIEAAMRRMMTDKNVDIERRMQAFLTLMQAPDDNDIRLALDMVNDNKESGQLRSLIFSYLMSARKSQDPSKTSLTERFQRVLDQSQQALPHLNLPFNRFSRADEKSGYLSVADIGASLKSSMLFHPETYVPRSIGVNLTTFILGEAINVVELEARAEGLEALLYKWFGPGGVVSRESVEEMFNIPDSLPNEGNRKKRSTDDQYNYRLDDFDNQVNIKESSPQGTLSMKMFGNEIRLFTMEDFPLLVGDLNDINIVEKLYELTKGSEATFKKNLVFLEAKQVVPSISGLSVTMDINGSAVVTGHIKGKVTSKNLFFGPKAVTLKGSIEPSATVTLSANLGVDVIYSSLGTHLMATTFTSTKLSGQIDYEQNKEFKVKLDVADKPMQIFNFTYDMFHSVDGNNKEITGSPKRAELDWCSSDLVDVKQTLGLDLCGDVSVPVSSHNIKAPYFPLTGPARLGINLLRKDTSLTNFILIVRKENDMYKVILDSPGTDYDRHVAVNLGLTLRRDRGMIGATFGKSDKGLTLEYRLDNKTNEVDALLSSNLTTSPMTLSMRFFNRTNAYTLDRQIGAEFNFKMKNHNILQTISYEDKYIYWAVRTMTSYAPGKKFHVDFEGHYEPKYMVLSAVHLPTDTRAVLRMRPSYPFTTVTFNMTHAKSINVQSSCGWHMENTEVKCDFEKSPGNERGMGYMRWLQMREGQAFNLMMSFNDLKAGWNGSYVNRGRQGKQITSNIIIPNHTFDVSLNVNQTDVDLQTMVDGQPVNVHGKISLEKQKKSVSLESKIFHRTAGATVVFHVPHSTKYEFCFDGHYNEKKSGFCLRTLTESYKKSLTAIIHYPNNNIESELILNYGRSLKSVTTMNGLTFCDMGVEMHRDPKEVIAHFMAPKYRLDSRMTVTVATTLNSKRFDVSVNDRYRLQPSSLVILVNHDRKIFQVDLEVLSMGKKLYSFGTSLSNTSTSDVARHNLALSSTCYKTGQSHSATVGLKHSSQELVFIGDLTLAKTQSFTAKIEYNRQQNSIFIQVGPVLISGQLLPTPSLIIKHVMGLEFLKIKKENSKWLTKVTILDKFYELSHNPADGHNSLSFSLPNGMQITSSLNIQDSNSARILVDIVENSEKKSYEIINLNMNNGGSHEMKVNLNHVDIRKVMNYLEKDNSTKVLKRKVINELQKGFTSILSDEQIAKIIDLVENFDYKTLPDDFSQKLIVLTKSIVDVVSPSFDMVIRNYMISSLQKLRKEILLKTDAKMMLAKSEISATISKLIDVINKESILSEKGLINLMKSVIEIGGESYTKQLVINIAKEALDFFNMTHFAIPVLRQGNVAQRKINVDIEKLSTQFNEEITRLISIFFDEYTSVDAESVQKGRDMLFDYFNKYTNNATRLLLKLASPKVVGKLASSWKNTLNIMKTWKLDETKSFKINFESLLNKLQLGKPDELIKLIFENINHELIKTSTPKPLLAIKDTVLTQNITAIMIKSIELSFDAMNITSDYQKAINSLLETSDIKEFLQKMAFLVVDESQATPVLKEIFSNFLIVKDIRRLCIDVYIFIVQRYDIPKPIKNELRQLAFTRNFTGLIREVTRYGLDKLNMTNNVKVMLMDLIMKEDIKQFIQDILKFYIDDVKEIPRDIKQVLHLLLKGDQTVLEVTAMLYQIAKNYGKDYPLALRSFGIVDKFVSTENITAFGIELLSLVEDVVLSKLDTKSRREALNIVHVKVEQFTAELTTKVLKSIPNVWRNDLEVVLTSLKTILKSKMNHQPGKDWPVVMKEFTDEILNVLQPYVADVVSKQIVKIAKDVSMDYYKTKKIGDKTLQEIVVGSYYIVENRFHFCLRILAQFLPNEMQFFTTTYITENGQFDLMKIYKDALAADYTKPSNLVRMRNLVRSLSDISLQQLIKFSGGLKINPTIRSVSNALKAMNNTELNVILEKLENIDWDKYMNITSPALQEHMYEILQTIGQSEYNGQLINSLFQAQAAIAASKLRTVFDEYIKLEPIIDVYFDKVSKALLEYKTNTNGFFLKSAMSLKHLVANSNKFQRFLLDISMPMIGGSVARLQAMTNKEGDLFVEQFDNVVDRIRSVDRWNVSAPWFALLPDLMEEADPHMSIQEMLQFADSFSQKFQTVLNDNVAILYSWWKRSSSKIKVNLAVTDVLIKSGQRESIDEFARRVVKMAKFQYGKLQTQAALYGYKYPMSLSSYVVPHLENATQLMQSLHNQYFGANAERIIGQSVPVLVRNATGFITKYMEELMFVMMKAQKSIKSIEALKDPMKFYKNIPNFIAQNLNDQFTKLRVVIKSLVDQLEPLIEKYDNTIRSKLKSMQDKLQNQSEMIFNILKNYGNYKLDPNPIFAKLHVYLDLLRAKSANGTQTVTFYTERWLSEANTKLIEAEKAVEKYSEKVRLNGRFNEWQKQVDEFKAKTMAKVGNFKTDMIEKTMKEFDGLLPAIKGNYTMKMKLYKKKLIDYVILAKLKIESALNKLPGLIQSHQSDSKKNYSLIRSIALKNITQWQKTLDEMIRQVNNNVTNYINVAKQHVQFDKDTFIVTLKTPIKYAGIDLFQLQRKASDDGIEVLMKLIKNSIKDIENTVEIASPIVNDYALAIHNGYLKSEQEILSIDPSVSFSRMHSKILNAIINGEKHFTTIIFNYQVHADGAIRDLIYKLMHAYKTRVQSVLRKADNEGGVDASLGRLPPLPKLVGFWSLARNIFKPLTRTALFFGNHVFTFDGTYAHVPDRHQCTYLLARDFRSGLFTILYSSGRVTVEFKDSRTILSRNKQVEVQVMAPIGGRSVVMTTRKELPVQLSNTSVVLYHDVVKITNNYGVNVNCQLESLICNVTLAGFYHNKTLGILGTNNVEYSDDLRMPNGKIAADMIEFVNSWEVTKRPECAIQGPSDYLPTCRRGISHHCQRLFKNSDSPFRSAFHIVDTFAFQTACQYKTSQCGNDNRVSHCDAARAYINVARQYNVALKMLPECARCSDMPKQLSSVGHRSMHDIKQQSKSTDIVLIIRQSKNIRGIVANLKDLLRRLDKQMEYNSVNRRYAVVAFNGKAIRKEPHVQTGNGHVFGDINDVLKALEALRFDGNRDSISLGLHGIRHAAGLALRPLATKIFTVFDDDTSYNGDIQLLTEVGNILRENSISLNVFNQYKFKKSVIAKDSDNIRYHMKIPKGEQFEYIEMPSSDNYMPLIKETRGAVLTIKSLMSQNNKWMKAMPITVGRIFDKQINRHVKQCQVCQCVVNFEGNGITRCKANPKAEC